MSKLLRYSDIIIPKDLELGHLSPPPRFKQSYFSNYKPQDPSQSEALRISQAFVQEAAKPVVSTGGWFKRKEIVQGTGLYLDGGFGVGKTHLLAAAFNAFSGTKAYMSFQELVYIIGALGKVKAQEELAKYKLICVDEFELDDPGNTLIVKTFLSYIFSLGHHVITTSNTPPASQGQGRFNAEDFKREIQGIAAHFKMLRLEGPDYRKRETLGSLMRAADFGQALGQERAAIQGKVRVYLLWDELLELLNKAHPIRYGAFLKDFAVLYVEGVKPIPHQNDALRFVHFIDKLYDSQVGFRASGTVALEDIFDSSYRQSAYAKKHYRCLSRLSELIEEEASGTTPVAA